jgi:hypothetical protein
LCIAPSFTFKDRSMTTLLAGRSLSRDLFQDIRSFFRSLVVAGRGDDAASTSFCWPRGL